MPHFIIECSENIIKMASPQKIMDIVYEEAETTELFADGDIKIRINPYHYFNVGKTKNDFIHVFVYIMEGRTRSQKRNLSKKL